MTTTVEQMDAIVAANVQAMRAYWGPQRWWERYQAALNTADESDVFMQLAAEMDARDEPMWASFYDLAVGPLDAECRAEYLAEIDEAFSEGDE